MKVLGFILQKEFRQIFRDKTILAMMFALPIIQLIILPFAANFEVKNVNVAFVDYDRSSYSQKLINKIASSGYFRIVGNTTSYRDALHSIEKNEADIMLEIPHGFERNLVREGSQQINMSVDAINGTKVSHRQWLSDCCFSRFQSLTGREFQINVTVTQRSTVNRHHYRYNLFGLV